MAKLIGFMIIASFVLLVLNLTGFCYREVRYLSNQELFESAIAHEAYRIGDYLPTDTPKSYLANHPNCCSIPVFQPSNSSLNALLGNKIRYIRVLYRMLQTEVDKNPREQFYEAFVETTPCGRTFHAIGTSRDTPD
ncbi:hypothetical protein IVB18_33785 [Bradyrhizobium sp. 186]|uniref:hypothetical protein n=1 Tax=Bradyrhizobium sp. 186 TaxID=2782654 RepID=UPI002000CBE1|nr:hypothetical protein [Bradyrhizobium sp. 186]UPK33162.1 hypothetical protein IVB18_33785 [Bradyrhizobium sp. 186]